MNRMSLYLAMVFAVAGALTCVAGDSWREKLNQQLPLLGHRIWIVIADAAYPWQTAPGIETVATQADQITVVKAVLDALAKQRHVRPIIYTDAELKWVPETPAPGITAYREALTRILGERPVQSLPHDQIISKLDESGQKFHVLLLKTKLTLPYTSVFLQLDCGYWSVEAERQLRQAIPAAAPSKTSSGG